MVDALGLRVDRHAQLVIDQSCADPHRAGGWFARMGLVDNFHAPGAVSCHACAQIGPDG